MALAAPLLLSASGHATLGEATGGVVVGGYLLGKMLTKPQSARIMMSVASGTPLGMSMEAASRVLSGAIKGGVVTMLNGDGSKEQAAYDGESFKPVSSYQGPSAER